MVPTDSKVSGVNFLLFFVLLFLLLGTIRKMDFFDVWAKKGKDLGLTGEQLIQFAEKHSNDEAEREERRMNREHERGLAEMQRDEAEKQRDEAEKQRDEAERQRDEAEKQRLHEIDMEQRRQEKRNQGTEGQEQSHKGKQGYIPKLPPFQEDTDDIDSFLYRFEVHATSCEWEEEKWPLYVASLLKGSALSLYHSLAAGGAISWDSLKTELLKKFQCSEEGFRDKFRHVRPQVDESFTAFLTRSGHLLDRWVDLSETQKSYQGLRDLILREQILQSVSPELGTFLRERKISNAKEMCAVADQYREARPGKSFARKTSTQIFEANVSNEDYAQHAGDRFRGGRYTYQNQTRCAVHSHRGNPNQRGQEYTRGYPRTNRQTQRRPYYQRGQIRSKGTEQRQGCWNCGCIYHIRRDCPKLPWTNVCHAEESDEQVVCQCGCEKVGANLYSDKPEEGNVAALFTTRTPVTCSNVVDNRSHQGLEVEQCSVNGFTASLLRDTGCTTAGVKKSLVNDNQYTGKVQRCRSFGGNIETFPLANIDVITPYYEGKVLACVIEKPVTDLILGNLPGVRTATGGKSGSIIHEEAMVTTRAQAKVDQAPAKPVKIPQIDGLNVTPQELIELQKLDTSLEKAFGQVRPQEGTLDSHSHCFVLREGILTRIYQNDDGKVYQIEVPKKLRQTVLQVAHDLPMSGHFGVRRTLSRVLTHFHWPTVRKDVTEYCLSCDPCQRTLPRGRIPCAPLQPMPLISEPFKRIAIDLVGPIHPVSSSGHMYILTIVDVATRYPEAIPLRKIDSVTVAEALVSAFCRMGCPTEILSDCGTQMISDVMKEVHKLLGVKTVTTTPYHPQSNGLVERFNGTIKSMIKRVVQDQPKNWDRMIPSVLFAYRELPNASTGFSPFELMFGRQAKGPIFLLSKAWSGNSEKDEEKNVYQYVFDLKNRLDTACTLAKQHVAESADKYKTYADKKARARTLQIGQQVLVLLSDEKNKMLTKWKGPYKVVEKTSPVDYRIDMRGQLKLFHINMLKGYVQRKSQNVDDDVQGKEADQIRKKTSGQEIGAILVNANVGVCLSESEIVDWNVLIDHDFCKQESPAKTSSEDSRRTDANLCMFSGMYRGTACIGMVTETEGDIAFVPTVPTVKGETVADVHISSELDSDTVKEVENMLLEFSDIITDRPGKAVGVEPHRIILTDQTPVRKRPYPLPFSTRQTVEKEVRYMLELGVIEPSTSAYSSPVVLVSKSDGTVRFCIDYRALNAKTVFDSEPIPDIEELFCQLAGAAYFAKIDLTKGYWQIPISEDDKDKTAFQTPLGLFQWTRMPFGLQNAPATFARVMRQLELQKHGAVSFFDDILVHAFEMGQLLSRLKEILTKLKKYGLCVRPTKMLVGFKELDFLGHRLARGQIKPQEDKVKKIIDSKIPQTKKQVRALLGLMGYYRRYIPDFASKASALTDLTKGSSPRAVKWTEDCQRGVEEIQRVLLAKPVLMLPDLSQEFILRTDASATGMGGVLLQEKDGLLHPVKCISKKFSETQLRYSTIERECLAIVWALTTLARYLLGKEFILQTDHRPLTFLKASKTKNNRLLRWALIIQEYRFKVHPISGRLNVLADMLSRV